MNERADARTNSHPAGEEWTPHASAESDEAADLFDPFGDEWANTLTHAIGCVVASAGWVAMAIMASDQPLGTAVACWVYSAAVFAVFFFSTLSHAVRHPAGRELMRAWDQGTIYLMIAGTYTPFLWTYALPQWRLVILACVWALAAVGFWSKVFARHRVNALASTTYLMLGWLPAVPMLNRIPDPMPLECLYGMLIGGLLYTIGVLFLTFDRRVRFFHAAWHLLVIAAAACHYGTIVYFIALGSGS